jgi:hypothetical protein
MKKCTRCNIVFHMDERSRCLYCDSLLQRTDHEDTGSTAQQYYIGRFFLAENLIKKLLDSNQVQDHNRVQFLVGSYFKSRTFRFNYLLSRNEYKMGKEYARVLIQPLGAYSLLMIPWVIWDVIDTFFFRLLYNSYCPRCKCKFVRYTGQSEHDPKACEYNKEFSTVLMDIVTGTITMSESRLKWLAGQKLREGKRSAYNDLCSRKNTWSAFADVFCIWLSVCLLVYIVVMIFFPKLLWLIHHFGGQMQMESLT